MGTISNQGKVFIVGMAGPSGSGKSTVAKRVASRLKGQVISMETYSMDNNHLPLEERAKLNYDLPDALDVSLLAKHVRDYSAGNAIDTPVYDFGQHLRVEGRQEHIPSSPLLIVEGILALYFPQLSPNYDLSIYLDAPDEVCFHRRKVRDITERQRPLELIKWQYENTVMPAARQYLQPTKRYANLVVESKSDIALVEKNVFDAISAAMEKRGIAAGR